MIPHISIRAFVHSPVARAAVEGALADRHLARAQGEMQTGGIAAAAAHHQKRATPDVLIVEAEKDVLAELPALADVCDAQTRVLVIGQANDVALYKCVMKQGVSEYLVAPVDAAAMVGSLCGLYEPGRPGSAGKIVAFLSARGGAGSSALSQSVAWCLAARDDKPVLLADLDMGFGAAGLSLDVQPKHKLTEAFRTPEQMDAALLDRLLIPRGRNLRLLCASAALVEEEMSVPCTRRLIELARSGFHRSVLDLPSEWSPAVREALLHADDIVVTALPDLISLRNTRAILDFLARVRPNDPAPKLILNHVGRRKQQDLTPAAFAEALKVKPTAILKSDVESFGKAENAGQTIPEAAARSAAARVVSDLARSLREPVPSASASPGLRFWRRR
ncbi:MAG: CpaE family protein [Pararhodobacter sp.]